MEWWVLALGGGLRWKTIPVGGLDLILRLDDFLMRGMGGRCWDLCSVVLNSDAEPQVAKWLNHTKDQKPLTVPLFLLFYSTHGILTHPNVKIF